MTMTPDQRPVFDFGVLFALTLVFFGGVLCGAGHVMVGMAGLCVGTVLMGGLLHVLVRQLDLCESCLTEEDDNAPAA